MMVEIYQELQKFKDELIGYYQLIEDGHEPNWRFGFFENDVTLFYSKLSNDEKLMYKKVKDSYDVYKEKTKKPSNSQKRRGLFRKVENRR